MQLIGMLDSPYVRRVAISLKLMGMPFEHHSVSVFRHFDRFSAINPVVKAPTLVCDDGETLMDSTLILGYLEAIAGPAHSLMPSSSAPDHIAHRDALKLIGLGLAADEKAVQRYYELNLRPEDKQHRPWIERVTGQLFAALDLIEPIAAKASPWLMGKRILQPDVTITTAWRFTHFVMPGLLEESRYPALRALSARTEALPEFLSTPLD